MREKTKYRLGVLLEFLVTLLLGSSFALLFHVEFGSLIVTGLIAALTLTVGIGSLLSPSWRRYMRRQAIGSVGVAEGNLVGKYTILEDEFDRVRNECRRAMCLANPDIKFSKWHKTAWDAVNILEHQDFATAVIPGMFISEAIEANFQKTTGDSVIVSVEGCVVAFWNGTSWEPTELFLLGNEREALPIVQSFVSSNKTRIGI